MIALWAWQITNRVVLARTGLEPRQFGSKLQLPLRQTSAAQMIFAKSLEGLEAGCPFQRFSNRRKREIGLLHKRKRRPRKVFLGKEGFQTSFSLMGKSCGKRRD